MLGFYNKNPNWVPWNPRCNCVVRKGYCLTKSLVYLLYFNLPGHHPFSGVVEKSLIGARTSELRQV